MRASWRRRAAACGRQMGPDGFLRGPVRARAAPPPPRSPARLGAALRGPSAVMDPSRVGPRAPSFTRFANHMLITLKWCSRYYPTVLRRKWRPEKSLARDTIGAGTGVSGTALLGPHPHSAPPPPRGQCQSP